MSLSAQALEDRRKEWKTLVNEFRLLEQSRKEYSEETAVQLRKQRDNIDFLRCENEALQNEVNTLTRHMSQSHTTLTQQGVLRQRQEASLRYAESIEVEKRTIAALKDSITEARKQLFAKQKQIGGAFAPLKTEDQINKHYRMLQQRLEVVTHKYNATKSQNKALREVLRGLKKERQAFENAHRRLDRDVETKKSRMNKVVESTNAAYEQRDSYLLEIAAIEEADRQHKREFTTKVREIDRQLEFDLKISRNPSRALIEQSSVRSADSLHTPSKRMQSSSGTPSGSPSGLPKITSADGSGKPSQRLTRGNSSKRVASPASSSGREGQRSADQLLLENIKKEVTSAAQLTLSRQSSNAMRDELDPPKRTVGDWGITEDKAIILLDNFEVAFERLRAATGIDDPQQVATAFSDAEARAHQLFRFVDEQLREIDGLRSAVNSLVMQRRQLSSAVVYDESQMLVAPEATAVSDENVDLMQRLERQNENMVSLVSQCVLRLNILATQITGHERNEKSSAPAEIDAKEYAMALVMPTSARDAEVREIDVELCLKQIESAVSALTVAQSSPVGRLSRSPSVGPNARILSRRNSESSFKSRPQSSPPVSAGESHLVQSQEESVVQSLPVVPSSPMHPASFRIPVLADTRTASSRSFKVSNAEAIDSAELPLSRAQIRSSALEAVQAHPLLRQRSLSSHSFVAVQESI